MALHQTAFGLGTKKAPQILCFFLSYFSAAAVALRNIGLNVVSLKYNGFIIYKLFS